MSDKIIIGIVVIVTIIGHVWIYKWIKFKMDEGIILKLLGETELGKLLATEYIASETKLKLNRVYAVCSQSNNIQEDLERKQVWCLNRSKI